MVNGDMMTVVWHVDDLKVLHHDKFKVTKFVQYMYPTYGGEIKLYIETFHYYIAMGFYYSEPVVVKLSMINI